MSLVSPIEDREEIPIGRVRDELWLTKHPIDYRVETSFTSPMTVLMVTRAGNIRVSVLLTGNGLR